MPKAVGCDLENSWSYNGGSQGLLFRRSFGRQCGVYRQAEFVQQRCVTLRSDAQRF